MAKKKATKKRTTQKAVPVPSYTGESRAQMLKYRAENDVRTLVGAEEIKQDRDRLKRAKVEAKQQQNQLKKVNPKG